jgi:membrane-associated phospholipid phosphatase
MLRKDLVDLFRDVKLFFSFIVQWRRKSPFIAIGIFIIFLLLFFVDPVVRVWFSRIHNNFSDTIFYFGHLYGKVYLTFFFMTFFYCLGLILKRETLRKTGWMFFESYAVSGIFVTVVKSILGRWRPYTQHGGFSFDFLNLGPNEHLSLPSGDVAVAFAFSTIMASLINNKAWKIFWFFLAGLTAIARIYHDQHWLTDVILAAFISISFGIQVVRGNGINRKIS